MSWSGAGTLQFLGRIDHQVKIRGQRVELPEIELCMQEWGKKKNSESAAEEKILLQNLALAEVLVMPQAIPGTGTDVLIAYVEFSYTSGGGSGGETGGGGNFQTLPEGAETDSEVSDTDTKILPKEQVSPDTDTLDPKILSAARESLKRWLERKLPSYMVPDYLVLVQRGSWPNTASGKRDRNVLKEEWPQLYRERAAQKRRILYLKAAEGATEFEFPSSQTPANGTSDSVPGKSGHEQVQQTKAFRTLLAHVLEAFRSVFREQTTFGREIDETSDFVDLGGDSIRAPILQLELRKRLSQMQLKKDAVGLRADLVFRHPQAGQLALALYQMYQMDVKEDPGADGKQDSSTADSENLLASLPPLADPVAWDSRDPDPVQVGSSGFTSTRCKWAPVSRNQLALLLVDQELRQKMENSHPENPHPHPDHPENLELNPEKPTKKDERASYTIPFRCWVTRVTKKKKIGKIPKSLAQEVSEAADLLVLRHQALRTSFAVRGGLSGGISDNGDDGENDPFAHKNFENHTFLQTVHPAQYTGKNDDRTGKNDARLKPWNLPRIVLGDGPEGPLKEACALKRAREEAGIPLELFYPCWPMRLCIVQTETDSESVEKVLLQISVHHVCFDAESTKILVHDFLELLRNCGGSASFSVEKTHDCIDFALWQEKIMPQGSQGSQDHPAVQQQLGCWRDYLRRGRGGDESILPILQIPSDFPEKFGSREQRKTASMKGDQVALYLDVELTEQLKSLGKSCNATMNQVMLTL